MLSQVNLSCYVNSMSYSSILLSQYKRFCLVNNGAVDMQVRLLLVDLGRHALEEVSNFYRCAELITDNS